MRRVFLKIYENEKGMTIPELLIAMGIMTITIAAAFSLLRVSQASWNVTVNKVNARQDTSLVMSKIVKTLRNAADPDSTKGLLDVADKNNVVFYANIDTDSELEKIQYQLSGTDLVQTVTQPDSPTEPWTYTGSANSTTIASGLTNDDASPLFSFFINGSSVSLPADATDRTSIDEVEVALKTRSTYQDKSEDVSLKTRVFFRNLH